MISPEKSKNIKEKKTFSYVRLVRIVLDGITSKLCKIAVEPVLLETIYQKINVSTLNVNVGLTSSLLETVQNIPSLEKTKII